MKIRATLPLLLFVGLLFSTCKRQDLLPDSTQTGQNAFGCRLNGKSWIPDGGGGFSGIKPISGGFYGDSKDMIRIYIRARNTKSENIHIYLEKPSIGEHTLNFDTDYLPNNLYARNYGYYQASDGQVYITSAKSIGKVIISKADTVTGLLSGMFEFRATTKSGSAVEITAGRFDMISPQ